MESSIPGLEPAVSLPGPVRGQPGAASCGLHVALPQGLSRGPPE